jgi:hypothetical protein
MAWDARKYRLNALECVAKAHAAEKPQEKAAFMNLSARWKALAEVSELEQALAALDEGETPAGAIGSFATVLH